MNRRMWLLVVALGLVAAACGMGSEEEAVAPAPEPAEVEAGPPAEEFPADEFAEEAGGEEGLTLGLAELPGLGQNVIKTADIKLEVKQGGFKEALQSVTQVATAHAGFVHSSSIEGEDARRGSLVIRVPSPSFDRALADLRDLGKVKRERITTEDVSQEFVDLEARLRNLEAQEVVLLRLMDEAQTVADTIRVQKELTGIQLEIERIKGRLRFLENQTSFGTISVALSEQGAAPAPSPGAIQRGWERATDAFLVIVSGVIASLGVVVPLAILGLIVWLVVRRVRPRPVRSP